MEQKMSEITAEKVKALLEGLKNTNEATHTESYYQLALKSKDIARAYLAKCEEVDWLMDEGSRHVLEKSIHKNAATILREENERLQAIVANQSTRQYLEHYQTKDNTFFTPEEVGFLEEGLQSEAEENQRLTAIIDKQRSDLQDVINIQSSNGNFDCNQYMHGMANGLICALSILTGGEPKYLEAPDKWLDDLQNIPAATCEENLQVSGEALALTQQQTNDGDVK